MTCLVECVGGDASVDVDENNFPLRGLNHKNALEVKIVVWHIK
jgi:hypothetical protein